MAKCSIGDDDNAIRPIVAVYVTNMETGERERIYALLDTGAARDFLTLKCARRLGLHLRDAMLSTTGINGLVVKPGYLARFQLESLNGKYVCEVTHGIMDNLKVFPRDVPPAQRKLVGCTHLEGVEFEDFNGEIEAVVGIGHADAFAPMEVRKGGKYEPSAWRTEFGWTLVGVAGKTKGNEVLCNLVDAESGELTQDMKDCFNRDFDGDNDYSGDSKDHRDAKRQLDEGVYFDEEIGRYVAPLPFKGGREAAMEKINAADSRAMNNKRFGSLRRALEKDGVKKEKAFTEMDKFRESGAVEEIPDDNDAAKADRPVWNLPVHLAPKPGQPEKCRFCMDARANANGTCLNNHLIGVSSYLIPIQQPCRDFRDPRFACTFDIKEFFHRVRVHWKDCDCFRFWFFGDRTMTTRKLYRWVVHIFGAASSPFVTGYVLQHHADKIATLFDEYVIETIRHRFYVDDGSGGKNTPEAYVQFVRQMNEAMKLGGFELGKWKFSHPTLVGEPPVKDGEEMTKFLGLAWNLKLDALTIAVSDFDFIKARTPREMVRVGARIFDLEGWFSPFVITGRVLIQRAMRCRVDEDGKLVKWGWDKPVDEELQKDFHEWASSIKHLARYYLPRCWNKPTTIGCVPELHVFGDASPMAYGAVAYRVIKGVDGVMHSNIICAKGHVVPADPARSSHHNSIPRLELVAAVKALDLRKNCEKLAREIKAKSGVKFSRTAMWTDSEYVLKSIFDTTTAPRGFVGNRVARIQDETTAEQWNYVPSGDNPADLITKGIRADEPEKWRFFHEGPAFLRGPESGWPEMTVNRHPTPPDPVLLVDVETVPLPMVLQLAEEPSEWVNKKFRVAAVVRAARVWMEKTEFLRLKSNPFETFPMVPENSTAAPAADETPTHQAEPIDGPAAEAAGGTPDPETPNESSPPSEDDADAVLGSADPAAPDASTTAAVVIPYVNGDDMRRAEMALVRAIQAKHFAMEIDAMTKWKMNSPTSRKEISRKSSIYCLNPFLDAQGVIRVGSRLAHANLDDEAKFPAVLPKKDPFVDSLIRNAHFESQHAGPLHVHANLRQRFWIVQGLPAVKRVIRVCPGCQKASKKPCGQKMAPLPLARVFDTHAWDTCGVDMMGPFRVKRSGSRALHKVYCAIFTCFQTRAIHIELTNTMEADSFILALARFTARRPGLQHLYSDNGSNFVGSFNILNKRAKEIDASFASSTHSVPRNELQKVSDSVRPRLLAEGIDWTFLPPYASHYAGVWERMIGLVKKHLARVSSGDTLHEETFHTAMVQIEGVVNDRPLTQIPNRPDDISEFKPLRPRQIINSDFTGDVAPKFVAELANDEGEKMRFRFEAARERVRAFWKAWREDYVTSLANRKKWSKTEKNLAIGDLVMIVDDSVHRASWELGRVVDVDDAEGHARKIFVKRPNQKVIVRDRTKLVHLELDEN